MGYFPNLSVGYQTYEAIILPNLVEKIIYGTTTGLLLLQNCCFLEGCRLTYTLAKKGDTCYQRLWQTPSGNLDNDFK